MQHNKLFTNIVWKEGKHFVAQCLNVDISSFGRSHAEALKNLEEAVELYLEDPDAQVYTIELPSLSVGTLGHFSYA